MSSDLTYEQLQHAYQNLSRIEREARAQADAYERSWMRKREQLQWEWNRQAALTDALERTVKLLADLVPSLYASPSNSDPESVRDFLEELSRLLAVEKPACYEED